MSIRMRIHQEGNHLSGAEDLVPLRDVEQVMASFSKRFLPLLREERDRPLQQIVTIDPVSEKDILRRPLLAVQTLNSDSTEETGTMLSALLDPLLPAGKVEPVLAIFQNEIMGTPPRNGAVISTSTGTILQHGMTGGIRTTHVGCLPALRKALEKELDRFFRKPNYRFVEALVLASKVISSGSVLLEICASDDPDYTTGYVASPLFGYVRLPHMKKQGLRRGGRLYVISPETRIPDLLTFLRSTPVLFDRQSPVNHLRTHPRLTAIPSLNETFSPEGPWL
ncbi:MAG: 6-carboxyhexanoate--CoA ligase [Nitrospirae bacterium]|nr:6-carboxyhexanoate--CoA ligase [Nitrospirota bacterium]